MTLKLIGLEGIRAQLAEVGVELAGKATVSAMKKSFKRVVDGARAMVAVRSGELRDSLKLASGRPAKDGQLVVGLKVGAGRGAKQARVAAAAFGEGQSSSMPASRRWHFEEFGTSRQPARPFLRPALDANAQAVVDDLEPQLRAAIERAVKRKSRGT